MVQYSHLHGNQDNVKGRGWGIQLSEINYMINQNYETVVICVYMIFILSEILYKSFILLMFSYVIQLLFMYKQIQFLNEKDRWKS